MKKIHDLVYIAILIALNIVITRFLSIQTPIVRIGFSFVPVAICSIFFGPLISAISAALADVLGFFVFPPIDGSPFFAGFTASAALSGLIFGLFLYKKKPDLNKKYFALLISAVILNVFIIDMVLNTFWLSILLNKAAIALLPVRLLKNIIFIPIEIVVISAVHKALYHLLEVTGLKEVLR